MEANYYIQGEEKSVRCTLCPHQCLLKPGHTGICRVRTNADGVLMSDNYGKVCSLHLDPIEKKPLYHFFPGRNILSVGTVGCNLHCRFCQNWEISQTSVKDYTYLKEYSPEAIVDLALAEEHNLGIAYTYNEPTVWFEFMNDIALMADDKGLKNVMVTNGYINPEPLKELIPHMHAFSVDLKAFTETFYKQLTSSSLAPVLESLKIIKASGRHFEMTNLLIPDENDNEKEFRGMMEWISKDLGADTVLHISRFFPTYQLINDATPELLLRKFYGIAREYLDYVYLGNVSSEKGRDTACPKCNHLLISRSGYHTKITGLEGDQCKKCGEKVPVEVPGA
jgi:pyruvate formate lyase activating enzyme